MDNLFLFNGRTMFIDFNEQRLHLHVGLSGNSHTGHVLGIVKGTSEPVRFSGTTRITSGMISSPPCEWWHGHQCEYPFHWWSLDYVMLHDLHLYRIRIQFQLTCWSKNTCTSYIDGNILKNGFYLWRIFVSLVAHLGSFAVPQEVPLGHQNYWP